MPNVVLKLFCPSVSAWSRWLSSSGGFWSSQSLTLPLEQHSPGGSPGHFFGFAMIAFLVHLSDKDLRITTVIIGLVISETSIWPRNIQASKIRYSKKFWSFLHSWSITCVATYLTSFWRHFELLTNHLAWTPGIQEVHVTYVQLINQF